MAGLDRPLTLPLRRKASRGRDALQEGTQTPSRPIRLTWLIGAVFFTAMAGLVPVVQTSHATATGYTVRQLERERQEWQARIYQRESDIAGLTALDRIDREARRLGLEPAQATLYLEVPIPAPEQAHIPSRFVPRPPNRAEVTEPGWQRLLNRLSLP